MRRTDQRTFEMVFLAVSCLVCIITVSGFVGSSFLAFRSLFPDLRTFIGTSLIRSFRSVSPCIPVRSGYESICNLRANRKNRLNPCWSVVRVSHGAGTLARSV